MKKIGMLQSYAYGLYISTTITACRHLEGSDDPYVKKRWESCRLALQEESKAIRQRERSKTGYLTPKQEVQGAATATEPYPAVAARWSERADGGATAPDSAPAVGLGRAERVPAQASVPRNGEKRSPAVTPRSSRISGVSRFAVLC